MRIRFLALGCALCVVASGIRAQSVDELRAQYQQTESMLNEAEAAGMDPSLTASLRESLEVLRQSIDEMERDQASSSDSSEEPQPEASALAEVQAAETNLAAATCSKLGFDEDNYREQSFVAGDEQLRALCGQAYEYYSMYKRALDQRHPEAWKTYDAHKQSAMVVNNFYGEARTLSNEGIRPDTRTAADDAAAAARKAAAAAASAPPRPPKVKVGDCPPVCPALPR